MKELEKAIELIKGGNHTLVLIKGKEQFISNQRGIRPMFDLVTKNPELASGASIADKVIGKAGALLAVFGGVKYIHALLTTHSAIAVCNEHNIEISFDRVTEFIKNRDNTGSCPMELLAHDVIVPEEMVEKVATFLTNLP